MHMCVLYKLPAYMHICLLRGSAGDVGPEHAYTVLRGRAVHSFICASPADLAGFLRALVYFPLASGLAFFASERLISQFWQISASIRGEQALLFSASTCKSLQRTSKDCYRAGKYCYFRKTEKQSQTQKGAHFCAKQCLSCAVLRGSAGDMCSGQVELPLTELLCFFSRIAVLKIFTSTLHSKNAKNACSERACLYVRAHTG